MYHGADELVPNAPAMVAYRQSMVDVLGAPSPEVPGFDHGDVRPDLTRTPS